MGAGYIERGHTTQTALNEKYRMPWSPAARWRVLGIKAPFSFCAPANPNGFQNQVGKRISNRITKTERVKEESLLKLVGGIRGSQADAEVLHKLNFYASVHHICFDFKPQPSPVPPSRETPPPRTRVKRNQMRVKRTRNEGAQATNIEHNAHKRHADEVRRSGGLCLSSRQHARCGRRA